MEAKSFRFQRPGQSTSAPEQVQGVTRGEMAARGKGPCGLGHVSPAPLPSPRWAETGAELGQVPSAQVLLLHPGLTTAASGQRRLRPPCLPGVLGCCGSGL